MNESKNRIDNDLFIKPRNFRFLIRISLNYLREKEGGLQPLSFEKKIVGTKGFNLFMINSIKMIFLR